MVRRAREYKNLETSKFSQNSDIFLRNHKVHFRGPVWSIEGPWLVLETLEALSCVPRVLWNVFRCSVCKNIADTADFRMEDDCAPPRDKLF